MAEDEALHCSKSLWKRGRSSWRALEIRDSCFSPGVQRLSEEEKEQTAHGAFHRALNSEAKAGGPGWGSLWGIEIDSEVRYFLIQFLFP